jgi:hypothetical protein
MALGGGEGNPWAMAAWGSGGHPRFKKISREPLMREELTPPEAIHHNAIGKQVGPTHSFDTCTGLMKRLAWHHTLPNYDNEKYNPKDDNPSNVTLITADFMEYEIIDETKYDLLVCSQFWNMSIAPHYSLENYLLHKDFHHLGTFQLE